MKLLYSILFIGILGFLSIEYVNAHINPDGTVHLHTISQSTSSGSGSSGSIVGYSSLTGSLVEKLICVRTAVKKREGSLQTALLDFNTKVLTAYSDRASALDTANQILDKNTRKTAVSKAWKDWKIAIDDAKKSRKSAHKTIWDTNKTDLMACSISSSDTDIGNASSDNGQ